MNESKLMEKYEYYFNIIYEPDKLVANISEMKDLYKLCIWMQI